MSSALSPKLLELQPFQLLISAFLSKSENLLKTFLSSAWSFSVLSLPSVSKLCPSVRKCPTDTQNLLSAMARVRRRTCHDPFAARYCQLSKNGLWKHSLTLSSIWDLNCPLLLPLTMHGSPFCLPPCAFLLFLHGKDIACGDHRSQRGEEATCTRPVTASQAPHHLSPAAVRTSIILTALCKKCLLENLKQMPASSLATSPPRFVQTPVCYVKVAQRPAW